MVVGQIRVKYGDSVRGIALQECSEKVGLVPGTALVDPIGRILERIVHVMKVDVNAFAQEWKNTKDQIIDITSNL